MPVLSMLFAAALVAIFYNSRKGGWAKSALQGFIYSHSAFDENK